MEYRMRRKTPDGRTIAVVEKKNFERHTIYVPLEENPKALKRFWKKAGTLPAGRFVYVKHPPKGRRHMFD